VDGVRDVAVSDGRIAAVAEDLSPDRAKRVLDVRDQIVCPGLIDIHAHVYAGVTTWGIRADSVCPRTGVTTVVDAGSPSWATLPGFRDYIAAPAKTRVLAYVHISGIGLVYGPVGEMLDLAFADPERTAAAILENPDLTVGVKVRQGKNQVGANGVSPLRLAIRAAELAKKPVMVHIGSGVPLPDILNLLRAGDVLTHCFHGNGDHLLGPDEKVLPEAWEARKRGVLFDVGHGGGSFSFEIARAALDQGFVSDVISTDLHTSSIRGPAFDLPTTMSKMLFLGLSPEEVIERTTVAPARAIGRFPELGTLAVGAVADIAVLRLVDGEFVLTDTRRDRRVANRRIVATHTIRAGEILSEA
jgi:dihydroorotase